MQKRLMESTVARVWCGPLLGRNNVSTDEFCNFNIASTGTVFEYFMWMWNVQVRSAESQSNGLELSVRLLTIHARSAGNAANAMNRSNGIPLDHHRVTLPRCAQHCVISIHILACGGENVGMMNQASCWSVCLSL
jgi:hypothetical protein